MKKMRLGAALLVGGISIALAGTASAGGFARGNADTDILFEDGNFNARAGVTYVNPTRRFSQHSDPGLVGRDYTSAYYIPSFAVKANLFDPLRCAGTYVEAYGGKIDYTGRTTRGKLTEDFSVGEYALTCAVRFDVGRGGLHVLGGIFHEHFKYDRRDFFAPGVTGNLGLTGTDTGYRVGLAYDIPEIAFRAQAMYRSGTSYGANGTLTVPGPVLGAPVPSVDLAARGAGRLPQSFRVDLQSGIAPGWLAFGSVKWTDWSVLNALTVTTAVPGVGSQDIYNWRDGWTLSAGVGHAFTDTISGAATIAWDRGVGTGWDLSSDTWTFGLGGSIKDPIGGELRAGVAYSHLTASRETRYGAANRAVGAGHAWAVTASYKLGF
jgi:long-chain fatty acid transport protein